MIEILQNFGKLAIDFFKKLLDFKINLHEGGAMIPLGKIVFSFIFMVLLTTILRGFNNILGINNMASINTTIVAKSKK